jgi:predicted DNA-binding protein
VSDAEAFEHYDDPAKREPAPGTPRRGSERPLTQHVPVRFPAETIEQVRRLAEADGMTVSAWIRRAVERTLRYSGAAVAERAEGGDDTRTVIERLQRDVADLAAALDRSESR